MVKLLTSSDFLPDMNQLTRVKLANKIWDSLAKDANYALFYPLLKDAIHPIFGEAVECFKDGHYHAAVALCRSAIECGVLASASIYDIKFSNMPNTNQRYIYSFSLVKEFAYSDHTNYNKALKASKARKIIDNAIETKINQIRSRGNFVMHYYNLLHKRLINYVQTSINSANRGINLIITKKEAETTLKDTAYILKTIGTKLLSNPPIQRDNRDLYSILTATLAFVIVFGIILSTIYIGFNNTTVIEAEVGLLTAYEFFIYNKYSVRFVKLLGQLVPDSIQNMLGKLSSKFLYIKKASIVNLVGATIFLIIFLFVLYLGSLTLVGSALVLAFSINDSYITIEDAIFGGIVGSWALDLFFKLFEVK